MPPGNRIGLSKVFGGIVHLSPIASASGRALTVPVR